VCCYYYQYKRLSYSSNSSIYNAIAITLVAYYLKLPYPSYNLTAPNKPNAITSNSSIYYLLTSSKEVLQSVTN
jgi:hypothetical protein